MNRPAHCYQCEKHIPWRAKCVYCGNPLCWTCQCNCKLSQRGSTPLDPGTINTKLDVPLMKAKIQDKG